MTQIMIQARAHEGAAEDFKAWCLGTLAPGLLARAPAIERLIVNVALPEPASSPYGGGESLQGDAFDAVLQVWVPRLQSLVAAWRPLAQAFNARVRAQHVYRLTDTEVLHKPDLLQGVPTPGIKLLRGLYLFDDLPDAAAKRMWAHHSGLAVKVHVGLARYARHWVDAVLTPGSPPIRGVSDLHFPDEASMRERYFDSPRGRDEILHDLGHFIQAGTRRFHGREYILKQGPQR